MVEKFDFHGYSSDWKLDIVKQGMSDWLGNNGRMTSYTTISNFKLTFYKRPLVLVRDFLFEFGVI